MKFAVLSGAYKNAGDFLIVDRSLLLLKHVYPECELKVYSRREPLDDKLDEINQCDALVFAGGPAYSPNLYPESMPLTADLNKIQTRFVPLGLGWYGADSSSYTVYEDYHFSNDMKRLITRMQRDSGLACRDWYTVRTLKANGYHNILMTGCPAWYNIDTIEQKAIRDNLKIPYQKICISDPADIANTEQALQLAEYIRARYPEADICFVFHRGIRKDNLTDDSYAQKYEWLADELKRIGIEIIDISYGKDGFKVYDDCDLHVGYRVHAHIYNLSMRNVSVLIEEDGRGAGVNNALGLPQIRAYRKPENRVFANSGKMIDRVLRKLIHMRYGKMKLNPYVLRELDDYLYILENQDYTILKSAFQIQRDYFETMKKYIGSIMA